MGSKYEMTNMIAEASIAAMVATEMANRGREHFAHPSHDIDASGHPASTVTFGEDDEWCVLAEMADDGERCILTLGHIAPDGTMDAAPFDVVMSDAEDNPSEVTRAVDAIEGYMTDEAAYLATLI